MYEQFPPELTVDAYGAVRVITLTRPDALNAINARLHDSLEHVWRALAADEGARAVVLTGAGRAFSAGGDLNHMVELHDDRTLRESELAQGRRVVAEMTDFRLPLVAAVNGAAVGLGCTLAACSDIVLMADTAFLADPHVAVGLTAGDGGAALWPLIVGVMKAKEYLLTGDRLTAEQAVACGLANRVVPADELMPAAMALAARLADLPPQAVQSTKRAINLHVKRAIAGILDYAFAEEFASFDTPEHQAIVSKMLARNPK